jgi:hypothetical protein
VKKIQKENPSAGSFIHWSYTGDLVKYAEARPDEVDNFKILFQLYYADKKQKVQEETKKNSCTKGTVNGSGGFFEPGEPSPWSTN